MLRKSVRPILFLLLAISVIVMLSVCGQEKTEFADDTTYQTTYVSEIQLDETDIYTETQSTGTETNDYDASIVLNDRDTVVNGVGASFDTDTLNITSGGTYHITGSLSDGQIYINSTDEDKKVKLVLDSVNVNCSFDAPLFVENSPKETVIILQQGSQNYFADTTRAVPTDTADYAAAAIYSKDDLQLEGNGELFVTGNFDRGIFSKNDIDIRGGNIVITSVDDGIRGKDSVEIENAVINITCGGDGIRTNETTEEGKGDILISSGIINITSELDSIQATGNVTVNGGTVTVTSGGGATEAYEGESFGMNGFARGSSPFEDSSSADEATPSAKGIKADKTLIVNDGALNLDCLDDSLHAPEITVNGGQLTMKSDDDGVHADETVTINGGLISITNSYEGVEGRIINIHGGKLVAVSADDGFNAATSESSAQQETQRSQDTDITFTFMGGMGGFGYDGSCLITMTDGYVVLIAEGDGIDSNGSVEQSGGTMIVYGPTMGANGALDYGGTYNISGGTVLATGALGMAQSVTGNGVKVLNFNLNGDADNFYAISDGQNNCKISFKAPKSFQNVVFASDGLSQTEAYSVYLGGEVTGYTLGEDGIYFDGIYIPGQLLATLS